MDATETIEVPDSVDACDLCGCSFAGVCFFRQTKPAERWICEGCNQRGKHATRGYASVLIPNVE